MVVVAPRAALPMVARGPPPVVVAVPPRARGCGLGGAPSRREGRARAGAGFFRLVAALVAPGRSRMAAPWRGLLGVASAPACALAAISGPRGAVRQAVAPRLRHDQGRPGRASMSGAGSDREDVGRISMHAAHGRKGAPRARPAGPVPFSLSGPYRRSVRRQGRTVGHPAPFPAEPAFRRPPGRRRG